MDAFLTKTDPLLPSLFGWYTKMSVEIKQKKKTIPKVVRDLAWNKWIGDDVAKHKCMCCEVNEIRMNNFHCGHVIAEANGGLTSVENLRPICKACNLSMGTENLDEFKKRCGFGGSPAPPPSIEKKEEPVAWYPGILRRNPLPKQIKWVAGTNSIQMVAEMQNARCYTQNRTTGIYTMNL
jgi:hypothetical protein